MQARKVLGNLQVSHLTNCGASAKPNYARNAEQNSDLYSEAIRLRQSKRICMLLKIRPYQIYHNVVYHAENEVKLCCPLRLGQT
jgi:hypothetical protein